MELLKRCLIYLNQVDWLKLVISILNPSAALGASAYQHADECAERELVGLRVQVLAHEEETKRISEKMLKRGKEVYGAGYKLEFPK